MKMTRREFVMRAGLFVPAATALSSLSACSHNPTESTQTCQDSKANNYGKVLPCTYTQLIPNIPAPDPAHLDQAFLKYHRPSGQNPNPFHPEAGAEDFYLRWDGGGVTFSSAADVKWDENTKTLTCLRAFNQDQSLNVDTRLPVDTEIDIWVIDAGLLPVQLGAGISINGGAPLPTKTIAGFPWPVAYCKLNSNGMPY